MLNRRTSQLIWTFLFASAVLTTRQVSAQGDDRVDYIRDVQPILDAYCVGCHTEGDEGGGLSMDDFNGLRRGGESGPAFTSGVPNSSRLLLMLSGKLEPIMPPEDSEAPGEADREVLARWIEQGAKGPDGEMPLKRELRIPEVPAEASTAKPLTAIALARDGDGGRIAKGSFGRVVIANLDDKEQTRIESQIDDTDLGKVNAIEFSSDGKRILVASGLTGAYGRAAIYDTGTGSLLREFVGHRDTLYAATFSPDESIVATAGYDRTIVLWDAESGSRLRELAGHNGAIFDLAFSPDGKTLVSACADETAKVWNVANGTRLDTLSQPEGEVYDVAFSGDGKFILAGSGDNRVRIWKLQSIDRPKINPLVATRFVDETPIVKIAVSPDDRSVIAVSESGNVKLLQSSDWNPVASLEALPDTATDLFVAGDGRTLYVSLIDGTLVSRPLPETFARRDTAGDSTVAPIWMDLGDATNVTESELTESQPDDPNPILDVPRHTTVEGNISRFGEDDHFRWSANRGEVWAIDADAIESSRIDPIVSILNSDGQPVPRVRLQAVRDSYFTFRGKNSEQINDFRIFNWQEMKLSEYLYAGGEVTRLQMHPRGPDSGFDVYPGEGKRWTYFGTSGTTHALGEPAYIVRPLPPGSEPLANGLPVFDIAYENDDDPSRLAGKNSRLVFTAPADGRFTVRITDTRGEGGDDYAYRIKIRPAEPGFRPNVGSISKPLHPGVGREFQVSVDRQDGFDGPVTFELDGLPQRLVSNFPLTIEAGQRSATGMIWAAPNEIGWPGDLEPRLTAWAMINNSRVERDAGSPGKLTFDPKPAKVVPILSPVDSAAGASENWTLTVRRGGTVSAKVSLRRQDGFKGEVSFGKERSGRNASQGVYVDNIGLNGLLILAGNDEREFFVTADETAVPGERSFFLTAATDGGLTSHPITVKVLP